MKRIILPVVFLAFLSAFCADGVKLPPTEKFKIVVLAGQSNMAGRGKIDPNNNKAHPRVLMLKSKSPVIA